MTTPTPNPPPPRPRTSRWPEPTSRFGVFFYAFLSSFALWVIAEVVPHLRIIWV